MAKKKKIMLLAKKAIAIQRRLDAMKKLYKDLDEITDALVAAKCGQVLVDNIKVEVVDNFNKKNTAFKATAFRRFEIKVS